MAMLSPISTDSAARHSVREMPDRESSTRDYARRFAGTVGQYFLDVQWRKLHGMLPQPPATVLDVGGGHAQLTPRLVDAGFHVTVLGSTPDCFDLLSERCSAGFQPVCGDLLKLPFPNNSFDVVVAFRMLAHVRAWQLFVAELCRVARRRVVVDYPDLRSVNRLASLGFSWKKRLEGNTRPYQTFRQSEMARAFSQHKFEVACIDRQFFFPMALYRGLRSRTIAEVLESSARVLGLTRALGSPVVLLAESLHGTAHE